MCSPSLRKPKDGFSHTDRLYEEYEYERRLKKRKLRLLTATEEAFAQLRKITEERLATKGLYKNLFKNNFAGTKGLFINDVHVFYFRIQE